jgi:peptide/nickel transport system substrate-binding protein
MTIVTRVWMALALMLAAVLADGSSTRADNPRRGGVLTVALNAEPAHLFPPINPGANVLVPGTKMFDTLIEIGQGGTFVPRLAETWGSSEDGKSYWFKIRDGVKFHDGKPLTAEDVAFSAKELWAKENPFIRTAFSGLKDATVRAPNTVVFEFSEPMPAAPVFGVLSGLAPVAPKHVYGSGDIRRNPAINVPVGSGPFKFKEWDRGNYVIVEKNPAYWDAGRPHLDQIVFKFVPDASARAAMIESGQADVTLFNALVHSEMKRLEATKRYQFERTGNLGSLGVYVSELNLRRKELADPKVREAISLAIDRQFMARTIFEDMARAASGPMPSTSPLFNKGLNPFTFDKERANKLLDEAGYSRGANGTRFSLTLDASSFVGAFSLMADYMKQALQDVGIAVEIRKSDMVTMGRRVYNDYNFDMTITVMPMIVDPQVSTFNYFWSKTIRPGATQSNVMNYRNDEMDSLIEQARRELDAEKRKAQIWQIQKIAARDMPLIFLLDYDSMNIFSQRTRGIDGNPLWAIINWRDVWVTQ